MASLVPSDVFYPLPWWRAQSLATSLEETRAAFPSAVATHYGYSTNRLGGETPSVKAIEAKSVRESKLDVREFARTTMDARQMSRWETCMAEAREAQKVAVLEASVSETPTPAVF